jgi:hypothetical protein
MDMSNFINSLSKSVPLKVRKQGELYYETIPSKPVELTPKAPIDCDGLVAELRILEAAFDPNHQYSDDHRVWQNQHNTAKRIEWIKAQLEGTA